MGKLGRHRTRRVSPTALRHNLLSFAKVKGGLMNPSYTGVFSVSGAAKQCQPAYKPGYVWRMASA
jgi:hypothetical protein